MESETAKVPRLVEKLATLGKVSASLAHELNNPAAAAARAAAELRETARRIKENALQYDCRLDDDERVAVQKLLDSATWGPASMSALERDDALSGMEEWLEAHGVDDAGQAAEEMLDANIPLIALQKLEKKVRPQGVGVVVGWINELLRLQSLLEDVYRSTARITELVSAIRGYSRATTEEIDVVPTIDNTLLLFGGRLRGSVEVKREYARDLPHVRGFSGGLHQVWTNLIDNALDAMPDGGVLTVRAEAVDGAVRVSICDTGGGIPPELAARVFDPFFTTKGDTKGTGLGLEITKRIIFELGGTIAVESVPGDTRFVVTLPTLA